jgi:hypothetical protein
MRCDRRTVRKNTQSHRKHRMLRCVESHPQTPTHIHTLTGAQVHTFSRCLRFTLPGISPRRAEVEADAASLFSSSEESIIASSSSSWSGGICIPSSSAICLIMFCLDVTFNALPRRRGSALKAVRTEQSEARSLSQTHTHTHIRARTQSRKSTHTHTHEEPPPHRTGLGVHQRSWL